MLGRRRADLSRPAAPGGALANLVFLRLVQHFLCYTCKEYVDDLARVPRRSLQVSFRVPRVHRGPWGRQEPLQLLLKGAR